MADALVSSRREMWLMRSYPRGGRCGRCARILAEGDVADAVADALVLYRTNAQQN